MSEAPRVTMPMPGNIFESALIIHVRTSEKECMTIIAFARAVSPDSCHVITSTSDGTQRQGNLRLTRKDVWMQGTWAAR